MSDTKPRKIVQFQKFGEELWALCDDGTLWGMPLRGRDGWRQMPTIPPAEVPDES